MLWQYRSRFHCNQCRPHSKRHLCDRCVTAPKCTEDNRSTVRVFRGSKATGSCKAILRLQNWVTEQGHFLYISLGANFSALCSSCSNSLKEEHKGPSQWRRSRGCLSCANWASELTTTMAINSCSSCIKVGSSQTYALCVKLAVVSRAHSRVFLL